MTQHDIVRFQAPELPSLDEIGRYFQAAERSRWFSNGGPCVTRLERKCADYLGLEHSGVAVNNATSGLMIALRACLGTASERRRLVAVPSFTFIATINAIVWAGFEPLFLDMDPDDWHQSQRALDDLQVHRESLAGVLLCSTFGTSPSPSRRRGLSTSDDGSGRARRRGLRRRFRLDGRHRGVNSVTRVWLRCSASMPRSRSRWGRAASSPRCRRRP